MFLVPVMSVLYSSMMQTVLAAETSGSGEPSVITLHVTVLSQRPLHVSPSAQSPCAWQGFWGATGRPVASVMHWDSQAVSLALLPLAHHVPALMLLASQT